MSQPTVSAAPTGTQDASAPSAAWPFLLAIVLGALVGFVEVALGDLMITGFAALAFTMLLGLLRPPRPWRWALLIGIFVPLGRLFAAFMLHRYTERAQIYEAFLVFLPAIVGAYGGSFMRLFINHLFASRQPHPPTSS